MRNVSVVHLLPAMLGWLVCLTSAGQAQPPTVEFVPDGSAVLVSWPSSSDEGRGMALVDVASGRLQMLADGRPVSGAACSPDGEWIVYEQRGPGSPTTRLWNRRTRQTRTLPVRIAPPYAWREDSRRLVGTDTDEEGQLFIVFFNMTEFGEALRVPVDVDSVQSGSLVWLPDTDNVVFVGARSGRRDVYTVEGGQLKRLSTTGDVLALALGRQRSRVIWARSSKDVRYILLSLYEFDTDRRTVRRLTFPEKVAGVNPTPQRAPSRLVAVTLAPRVNRLAVVTEYPRQGNQPPTVRLHTMRLNGAEARLVRTVPLPSSPGSLRLTPCYSRVGDLLAVLHEEAGSTLLAIFRSDGTGGRVAARSATEP